VGRSEGKRLLERPRSRWENNMKVDPQDMRWGGGGIDYRSEASRHTSLDVSGSTTPVSEEEMKCDDGCKC
jgi:hypothetical protein